MEDKIKINDKTAWFAKELSLAVLHDQFMEKFAIECNDNKGNEWYGWKESDSPQKVWDWVEPRLEVIPIEPPVILQKGEFSELKNFMANSTARISDKNKWIVFDDNLWFVYEQPYGKKVKKILETENFLEALALLSK